MLTKEIRQQIEDFVRASPRTVQEVALAIDRNWRTADRYIQEITQEFGTIATRTFREGTRGALKLVYWNALSGAKGTTYQERLRTLIESGRTKYDFSPMHIYQYADPARREAVRSTKPDTSDFAKLLGTTQRQLLSLSGNLSWIKQDKKYFAVIEELVKRKVHIKIITRIDLTSQDIARKLLQLNETHGDDYITIRHCEQPLRCVVIDDTITSIKEVFSPSRLPELKEMTYIYYRIADPVWIVWLQKVFWHLWEQSIDAQSRIDALKTIREVKN